MTPDARRWARINDLFHRALEQPSAGRDAWLTETCGADVELRREVASLLAAHARAGDFLHEPAASPASALQSDANHAAPPPAIGPYRIDRLLGEGGMGVVYLAEDTRLGRLVALKAVASRFSGDAQRRERLRREARAAASLNHPGIATIFALEEIDGHLYLASEYVPGETLRDELQRGPLPIALAIGTTTAIARALGAAHDAGIVHRDLKPENVIRTPAGDVKILDFGLARFRATGSSAAALTGDGAILGTPAYMSPEQLRAGAVDHRSDLFAFGILIYELVSGVHPFAGSDPASTIARILESEPPRLSGAVPSGRDAGLIGALEPIVLTCLRKNPGARFRSAHEIEQALSRLSAGLGSGPPAGAVDWPADAGAGGARWWWQFHQAAASAGYLALLAPLWLVRDPAGLLGTIEFAAGVIGATAAAILRWHLWFTLRAHPASWRQQQDDSRPWLRAADLWFVLVLTIAGVVALESHKGLSILLLAAAMAALVSALVIEPATTRAALEDDQNRT